MFDPKPPAPKALPDDELNARIAQLQLQPDGLVAAMAFIEEQSKLRQEDALALSRWQLEAQMNAASQPVAATTESEVQDPSTNQPTVDIFAGLTQVGAPAQEVEPEVTPTPIEPSPVLEHQSKPAAENIEDIVAALNASYAEAATEPDATEIETETISVESASVELISERNGITTANVTMTFEEVTEVISQETPEPVQAYPSTQSINQIEEDLEQELEDQVGPTRTSAALVWSFLALASTPLILLLAAVLKNAGTSLAQAVIMMAALIIANSLLASVGAVAAARGSASLTTVSRAAFGVWGNSIPALAMLLVRLIWIATLVYLVTKIISPIVFNQPWFGSIANALVFPAEFTASLFVIIPVLLIAASIAGLGGQVLLRSQQVTATVSLIGIGVFAYFVASSYSLQDLSQGEPLATAPLLDTALFVFALFGFAVFSASGDFARKLPEQTPSAKVFFLSFVATLVVPLAVGLLGVIWLYMGESDLAGAFQLEVLATVAIEAPIWIFVVFVVALGLSMVQLVSMGMYSMSGNLLGLVRMPNWATYVIGFVLVFTAVLVSSYFVAASDIQSAIAELIVLGGVVAAAWSGVVVSDAIARTRRYHEVSLTREYGFYGKFNIANLIGFALSLAIGFGYLNGTGTISNWAGYLGDLTPEIFELAGSFIGIPMAFGLAILFPVVFGIPRIRKQERNLAELDLRREELKEFLEQAQ